MLTPKQRFLRTASSKTFLEISHRSDFADALDAALLQFVQDLPFPTDGAVAAGNAYRVEGAKRFAAILAFIAAPITEKKTTTYNDNLES